MEERLPQEWQWEPRSYDFDEIYSQSTVPAAFSFAACASRFPVFSSHSALASNLHKDFFCCEPTLSTELACGPQTTDTHTSGTANPHYPSTPTNCRRKSSGKKW